MFPVLIRAVFDQDIYYKEYKGDIENFSRLKKYYHHLYYIGQLNMIFDSKIIALWVANAIIGSTIIFFFSVYIS